jgi:hypothetical protein
MPTCASLEVEGARFVETSLKVYETKQRHIPGDSNLHSPCQQTPDLSVPYMERTERYCDRSWDMQTQGKLGKYVR